MNIGNKTTVAADKPEEPTQRPDNATDCPICDGVGVNTLVDTAVLCPSCNGTGFVA
jgi:DnaJ-class molecular chaperone